MITPIRRSVMAYPVPADQLVRAQLHRPPQLQSLRWCPIRWRRMMSIFALGVSPSASRRCMSKSRASFITTCRISGSSGLAPPWIEFAVTFALTRGRLRTLRSPAGRTPNPDPGGARIFDPKSKDPGSVPRSTATAWWKFVVRGRSHETSRLRKPCFATRIATRRKLRE
jgi:hypothetical protein